MPLGVRRLRLVGLVVALVATACGGATSAPTPARVDEAAVDRPPSPRPVPTLPDPDGLSEHARLRDASGMRTRADGPVLVGPGACDPPTAVRIAERDSTQARVLLRGADVDLFVWVPASALDDGDAPQASARVPSPVADEAARELLADTHLYDEAGTLIGRVRHDTALPVGADGQLQVPTPCGPVRVRALGFAVSP